MENLFKEFLTEFRDFKNQVTSRLDRLEGRFDNLENRFDKLEGRFDNLENRFDKLEGRFDNLENRFDKLEDKSNRLENRFDKLEVEIDIIKIQQQENTQILRALEHKAEVHKAEMDNLHHQLAKIEGTVNEIKENKASINELLGEHDIAIKTLKRRPLCMVSE